MAICKLGSRQVLATLDQTGLNSGNWTAQFTDSVFNVSVPSFSIFHIYLTTSPNLNWLASPAEGQFQVWINGQPWDFQPYSANNSWDPAQPMPLIPGDEVDFFFNNGLAPAPLVVCWLQWDDGS